MRWLSRLMREEEGQVLVVAALGLAALLGFAALAIDVGFFMWEKRALQNAADASALAGVMELPRSPETAVEVANAYAVRNGVESRGWVVEAINVSTDATTITVSVAHPNAPFMLGRVLGLLGVDVRARATAAINSPRRLSNVMPWMLKRSVYEAAGNGDLVILKYDARNPEQGNFGPLAIEGRGSAAYRRNIQEGAVVELQVEYDTEPGNMVGPTQQGLQRRLSETIRECDEWDEAFSVESGDTLHLSPQCNPWLGKEGSKRVVAIPLVEDTDLGGRTRVRVVGLALAFLEDFQCLRGNECQVMARLAKAVASLQDPESRLGPFNPNVGIRVLRLVQ
jgi:hypothetical protein